MTGILIFILFLMNILLILMVIVLYLRQNRLIGLEQKQQVNITEAEDMISAFLLEIREENEQFISNVEKMQKFNDKPVKENRTADFSDREHIDILLDAHVPSEAYTKFLTTNSYSKSDNQVEPADLELAAPERNDGPLTEQKKKAEWSELPYSEQVFYLFEKGLGIEEIAKTLNKGKTEIDLLLKFHKRL